MLRTGVLSNAKRIAETVRRVSPDTLVKWIPSRTTSSLIHRQVVLDGVCSVASEEIRFDEWDIDVVVSATQKGLGTPPGLSVVMASPRAIKVYLTTCSCAIEFDRRVPIGVEVSINPGDFVLCQLAQVCTFSITFTSC